MTGSISDQPTGPFAMMQRALAQHVRPTTPKEIKKLRARLHPDYDSNQIGEIDYKTRLRTDQDFANKFSNMEPRTENRTYIGHENSVDGVAWLSDNSFASTSHDGFLKIWDAETADDIHTLEGPGHAFYHCSATSDGRLIAGSLCSNKDNLILWDSKNYRQVRKFAVHTNLVFRSTWACNETRLLSSVDRDGGVAVHDVAAKSDKPIFHRNTHHGPCFDSSFCYSNNQLLMTCGHDGSLQWWDMRDRAKANYMRLPSTRTNYVAMLPYNRLKNAHKSGQEKHAIYGVEWLDQHTVLSCGGDYIIKRFDLRKHGFSVVADDMCDTQFLGHTSGVRSMAVTENNRTLVTGCEDGSVRVWDLKADPVHVEKPFYLDKLACRMAVGSQFSLNGHSQHVTSLGLRNTSDGGLDVLSGSWDQTCRRFHLSASDLDRKVTRHRSPTRSRKQDSTPY